MTDWRTTSDGLPPLGEWVLIWLPDAPWYANGQQDGTHLAKVAAREETSIGPNNPLPWRWNEFGPDSHRPSEVPYWAPIDHPDR